MPHAGASVTRLLAAAVLLAAGAGEAGRKDGKDPGPKTFRIEEAGVELTLNESWFPQPLPPGRKAIKMLTSLRDLSQLTLTPIPYQAQIDEGSFRERTAELASTIRSSHPEFEVDAKEIVPGDPPRLHLEGRWFVETSELLVCVEVFPVKARTMLVVLTTQKKRGNRWKPLADLLRNETRIIEKPLPAPPAGGSLKETMGGCEVEITVPAGWRPALDEELSFLEQRPAGNDPAAGSELADEQFVLVHPTLGGVSPSLALRSSPGAVPVSAGNLERFEELYRKTAGPQGPGFTIEEIAVQRIGGVRAFLVRGTATRGSLEVTTRQFFVPAKDATVLATLTCPGAAGEDHVRRSCDAVLSGIVFGTRERTANAKKPPSAGDRKEQGAPLPPGASWALGGAGALALALLVLLAVRRRKSAGKDS